MALDRDDLIFGLTQIVARLRERGEPAGIRIVGGAALSLRYFERRTTEDIDATLHPAKAALAAAREIGRENNWPEDWLNDNAAQFVPFAKDVEWEPLFDEDDIGIWVASAPALLAMKLKASRAGRDDNDIADLLSICEVQSITDAEDLYETYYPGEALEDKAYRMLTVLYGRGIPGKPATPPRPTFG